MLKLQWMGKAALGSLLLVAAAVADEATQGNPPVQTLKAKRIVVTKQDGAAQPQVIELQGDDDGKVIVMGQPAIKLSEYWLGVHCGPLPALLRAHLDVPADQGVLAVAVMPDSPAAKAGLKEFDVLLKVNDQTIGDVGDLVKAIDEAAGKEVTLAIVRQGKPETVKVTPEKRPDSPPPMPGGQLGALQSIPEGLQKALKPGTLRGPLRLRFIHPGVVLPPGSMAHAALPGNMSISITKEGDQPAKIVVKRGDESWETTEKDLDKLPEDVRPHVRRMLEGVVTGPDAATGHMDFVPDVAPTTPGDDQELEKRLQEHIDQQLKQMNARMKELQKMVEKLHEDQPGPEQEEQP
ncbi:MAG: PDZ domain-containing protein [Pirellulales bacterium]|nr:PDZ domain-containing protein [Pirellulales bacterium]